MKNSLVKKEFLALIIGAMEDQHKDFVYDLRDRVLRPQNTVLADEEQFYYPLPKWSSLDGFRLLEQFAFTLDNTKVQKELIEIVKSRQGVFKCFKSRLSQEPLLKKKFEQFKSQYMGRIVKAWLDELAEYSQLPVEQFLSDDDDISDLFYEDFVFSIETAMSISQMQDYFKKDCLKTFSYLSASTAQLLFHRCTHSVSWEKVVAYAAKHADEGCAAVLLVEPLDDETSILLLLYIEEAFSGFGVEVALLEYTLQELEKAGKKKYLCSFFNFPDICKDLVDKFTIKILPKIV